MVKSMSFVGHLGAVLIAATAMLPATGHAQDTEAARVLAIDGDFQYRDGAYVQARATYTRALEKDPASFRALNNRAMAHIQLDDLDAALADLNAAIAIMQRDGVIWNNRANVNCRLGRTDQAYEDRLQALYKGRFTALAAQNGLRNSGFFFGPTDGIWAADSDAALRDWTEAGCPRAPKSRLVSP